MDDKEVYKNFKKDLSFGRDNIAATVGIGNSTFNMITLNRTMNAIIKYFKVETNIKNINLSTNSFENESMFNQVASMLYARGFNVRVFNDKLALMPEISFAMKDDTSDAGIYINSVDGFMSLHLLNENGDPFDEIKYAFLEKYMEEESYDFDYQVNTNFKLNVVDNKIKDLFDKQMERFSLLGTNTFISDANRVIINTTSPLVHEKIKKLIGNNVNVIPYLSEKYKDKDNFDISETSSFREVYDVARKEKIDRIINISGSGSKVTLYYKYNKT
jgi:hypothetical protein